MTRFGSLDELRSATPGRLGVSSWRRIDQQLITGFADLTGDRQWIHVDPVRAATGPFGAPIAHGFLVLSLVPVMLGEVLWVTGLRIAVNYGLDRVRFPAPVTAGSAVRGAVDLLASAEVRDALQVRCRVTVELAGGGKPCCVAESLFRFA